LLSARRRGRKPRFRRLANGRSDPVGWSGICANFATAQKALLMTCAIADPEPCC